VVQPLLTSKETLLMHLGSNFEENTPLFFVDGSYNFENNDVGTGLVLVENREITTGYSYVKKIKTTKTNICEYVAILDALRIIKRKKIHKAIVITDQEHFAKGINIDLKKTVYEPVIKPYMKEIKQLMLELEGKVVIEYVGNLKAGNKNPLFQKAHLLSREYKKKVFVHLEIAS
jgi:ribonuclease HI